MENDTGAKKKGKDTQQLDVDHHINLDVKSLDLESLELESLESLRKTLLEAIRMSEKELAKAMEGNVLSEDFWKKYALGELLGDTPSARTLQFLLVHRNWDYSLRELAKQTHVGYRTFYRYVPKLINLGVLRVSRRIGATRLYRLNEKSSIVQLLDKLLLEIGYNMIESKAEHDEQRKIHNEMSNV